MRWLAVALVGLCVACSSSAGGSGADGPAMSTATSNRDPAVAKLAVAAGPVGLAVDAAGAVWVAAARSSQVGRIRSGAQDLTIDGIDVPLRLVATETGVWATAFGSGDLVRIAADGTVTRRVP